MIRINRDTLHAGVVANKSSINLYDLTLANTACKIILAKRNLIKMFFGNGFTYVRIANYFGNFACEAVGPCYDGLWD